jgi:DNA-binding SARP family transcriptional activator/tetratricopeptide (TPR) repeat protein
LCGDLVVELDGQRFEHALPGRQGRMLFAFLALNCDRSVSRDELIEAVWGEDAPADADAALRTRLSKLRHALGVGVLDGRAALTLELPEGTSLDIEQVNQFTERAERQLAAGELDDAAASARAADALARRRFLPGIEAAWIDDVRRRLEDVRLRALETLAMAGLQIGGSELGSAEGAARDLIEASPLRESGYRCLMAVHAARGNVSDSLQVYEHLRCRLREELGSAPSPAISELHTLLLRAGDTHASGTVPEQIPLPPPALRERGAFVGRAAVVGRLDDALAAARGGRRTFAFISGEPGIGKTRLAQQLARRAHAGGATVLWGQAFEETLTPYEPLLVPLRAYVRGCPADVLAAAVGAHAPELARLVPELRARLPHLAQPQVGDPRSERSRLFQGLAELMTNASQATPVLLVLDDMHWADQATLLFLRELGRFPDQAALLVLVAHRDTEPGNAGVRDLIADLRRETSVDEIHLAGLDECESAALIADRVGSRPSSSVVQTLHGETDGNPFFLEELVRHFSRDTRLEEGLVLAADRLPDVVKDVTSQRIARLDPAARRALTAAAVVGRDFSIDVVAEAVGVSPDILVVQLEGAVAAGLVVDVVAGRYGFTHVLTHDVVYEGVAPTRRSQLHRAVGDALVRLTGGGDDEHLGELAHHFALAGDGRAAGYAVRAGDRAMAMLAYEEAARHYSSALEATSPTAAQSPEACDLLLSIGEAHLRAGDRNASRSAFKRAAEVARTLGDDRRFARGVLGIGGGRAQVTSGAVDRELVVLLEEAIERVGDADQALRAHLLVRLAVELYWSDEHERRMRLADDALAAARSSGDDRTVAHVLVARRFAQWGPDNLGDRTASAEETLELAARLDDPDLALEGHCARSTDLLEGGEVHAAWAEMELHERLANERRHPFHMWVAAMRRTMRPLFEGRLTDVEPLAQEAVGIGRDLDEEDTEQGFAVQMDRLRRHQGRGAEIVALTRQFAERSDLPVWRMALASLYAELGREPDAREQFELVAKHGFGTVRRDVVWTFTIATAADVCAFLADRLRAPELYELLVPHDGKNVVVGYASDPWPVSRSLGLLATTMRSWDEASVHFEAAIVACRRSSGWLWLVRSLLDYARMMLTRGDPGDVERGTAMVDEGVAMATDLALDSLVLRATELRTNLANRPSAAPGP